MSSNRISRRTFVGGAVGLFAAAPLLPKALSQEIRTVAARSRLPNPWVENGKPVVAVIRGTTFGAMLAKGLEMLGGFSAFGSGKTVTVKPNFIFPEPYPETTDSESIITVVETLQREGFSDITVADSGSRSRPASLAFDRFGLHEKAEAGKFKLLDLITDKFLYVKNDSWQVMPRVEVFESTYHSQLIVNMPVIKQHSGFQYTCALKNNVGPISYASRLVLHRQHERGRIDEESRIKNGKMAIAETAHAINPEVTIIDARQVMGKSHHRSSGGVISEANRIIISGDQLAADRVAAQVLAECHDGFQVVMAEDSFNHAATLNVGAASLDDVVIKEAAA